MGRLIQHMIELVKGLPYIPNTKIGAKQTDYSCRTNTSNQHTLGISCFALTVELATRFLDDYILGSPYFKTDYPEHNLVRTRCQIALAKDMLVKMDAMEKVIQECVEKYK